MPNRDSGNSSGGAPIRDAACVALFDKSATEPRLLLGRRRETQVFLPNKWVFPGGRVDDGDRELSSSLAQLSAMPDLSRERLHFALAAIRELYEEAGVLLGDESDMALPAAWLPFAKRGYMPAPALLTPLARAITPPGRPRRFDTWFFLADYARAQGNDAETDGELLDLGWFTLAEVRNLDLPFITRIIVDDVATQIAATSAGKAPPIPFYFQDNEGYRRTLINI